MKDHVEIRVRPEELDEQQYHVQLIARKLGIAVNRIRRVSLAKRSVDARHKTPQFLLRYLVYIDEEPSPAPQTTYRWQDVRRQPEVFVIGCGPAGLFAALRLIELGLRPIVIERGKPVRERRHDVAAASKRGTINPDSNYCFGEGGAGTFSDGKLYTRSTKRGSVERILSLLVQHGASPDILIDTHPHIGTNKLPQVVSAVSESIRSAGGELLFDTRIVAVERNAGKIAAIRAQDGRTFSTRAVVLATGHSARDIFQLLSVAGLRLEAKPFALGVRIEHPQGLIDEMQYGSPIRHCNLPAASYTLRAQIEHRGVFSFCMCPGGVICPAATTPNEVVVNGWSPSKRNTRFANSGIVVEVSLEDLGREAPTPLGPHWAGVALQQRHEQRSFEVGGGALVAPAQRLVDFVESRVSSTLPDCSYNPGIRSAELGEVFDPFLHRRLQAAVRQFQKSRPGYLSNEAVAVAVESRTSSPIRIPRDSETLMHPDAPGLFPCAEGAGYAGGIMSAALDGERVAEAAARYLSGTR
ncbi:MAG: hypothetical protein KDD69_17300 [Bdellovibrionales bacterium]|nr:hypothetical protein [Bdellovibrionales bacterium]